MTKITIFFPFVLLALLMHLPSLGQEVLLFTAGDQEITADDSLAVYGHSSESLLKAEVFFHNNTDDDLGVWVRKLPHDVLPGTMNTFCWNGSCFSPDTYESPTAITLEPGETSTANDFYAEYIPMDNEGVSIIGYEFFCVDDSFASVTAIVAFVTRESFGPPAFAFNPEDGSTGVTVDQDIVVVADQPLRHADGTAIVEEDAGELIGFYVEHDGGDPVGFTVSLNLSHTMLTIHPSDPLHHSTTYFLGLEALMGFEGQVSEPQSVEFTTEEATNVVTPDQELVIAYPNPTSGTLHLMIPGSTERKPVRLFDMEGRLVWFGTVDGNSATIRFPDLPRGLYNLAIDLPDGRVVRRISIAR